MRFVYVPDFGALLSGEQVPNTSGKKALAMEAYARALRQLPTIIADNGGYDGSDLISSLRAAHAKGAKVSLGLESFCVPIFPRVCAWGLTPFVAVSLCSAACFMSFCR